MAIYQWHQSRLDLKAMPVRNGYNDQRLRSLASRKRQWESQRQPFKEAQWDNDAPVCCNSI